MRKILKTLILSTLPFSMACNSTAYQGVVKNVFAFNGRVYIYIRDGGNVTYCDQSQDFYIAWLDPESDYGKMMFAIALTSKTTEKLVWVSGGEGCISAASGNKAETLQAIDLKG